MSVARVGKEKPFVLLDRPNAIDWNSKEKVREYLTTLVGRGEVSLADSRRIRIGRELPREYTRSRYAEKAFRNMRLRKLRGKTAQHLDELIIASGERSGEPTRHKAREGGVYYRRTVDFGVMGHDVKRGYTAELLTYEVGGEEQLYDLVNIKEKPTLTDSLRRTDRGALEILSPNRADLTHDSIANRGGEVNGGDGKFSVGRLYTGSAADYERPSLHYVGTGEGSQVYGWGLYASDKRGVADRQAGEPLDLPRVRHDDDDQGGHAGQGRALPEDLLQPRRGGRHGSAPRPDAVPSGPAAKAAAAGGMSSSTSTTSARTRSSRP